MNRMIQATHSADPLAALPPDRELTIKEAAEAYGRPMTVHRLRTLIRRGQLHPLRYSDRTILLLAGELQAYRLKVRERAGVAVPPRPAVA